MLKSNKQYHRSKSACRFKMTWKSSNDTAGERNQDLFKHLVGMSGKKTGIKNVDEYIDRAHRVGKITFIKNLPKNLNALLLHLASHNSLPVKEKWKLKWKDEKGKSLVVKEVDGILLCFADINCFQKVDESREDNFFTSIDNLEGVL